MKRSLHRVVLLGAVMVYGATASLEAQTTTVKAEVWDVRGPATFTVGTSTPRPVETGTVIPPGAVVKTGVGAALDISFGKKIGSIRLPQNTVLGLDKLDSVGKSGTFDVQLSLTEGTLLGEAQNVPENGRFDVKTLSSVTGIRSGKFRIQAEGYVVLLSGHILNVYIAPGTEPALYKLNAPPPVYFSPTEAVRPAPAPLIREVQGQLQARLKNP